MQHSGHQTSRHNISVTGHYQLGSRKNILIILIDMKTTLTLRRAV